MHSLINHINSQFALTKEENKLLEQCFIVEDVPAQTTLLEAGKIERYIYFIKAGIVKGYQNIEGKLVVQHLVADQGFFTSLDSFMNETPAVDYYETITHCSLIKISKPHFELLQEGTTFWNDFVKAVTNEHLHCKMERVKDFQTLTAKERYQKFVAENPKLALNVSIDNMASFLGMEPQSLSRIRKQVTF